MATKDQWIEDFDKNRLQRHHFFGPQFRLVLIGRQLFDGLLLISIREKFLKTSQLALTVTRTITQAYQVDEATSSPHSMIWQDPLHRVSGPNQIYSQCMCPLCICLIYGQKVVNQKEWIILLFWSSMTGSKEDYLTPPMPSGLLPAHPLPPPDTPPRLVDQPRTAPQDDPQVDRFSADDESIETPRTRSDHCS